VLQEENQFLFVAKTGEDEFAAVLESGFDVKIMVPGHKRSEKCDAFPPDILMHIGNSFSAHLIMHRSVSKLLRNWKPDIVIETVNTIPFFFRAKNCFKKTGYSIFEVDLSNNGRNLEIRTKSSSGKCWETYLRTFMAANRFKVSNGYNF
jgi:hypothetical protein